MDPDLTPANWAPALFLVGTPLIATYFATRLVLWIAHRRRVFDVPNERSSHAVPTPRSGGVAIVIGVAVTVWAWTARGRGVEALWILPAVVIACAAGLWDDVRTLRPRFKMGLLVLAAAAAAAVDHVGAVRGLPFAGDVALGWAALPLTLFWLACYPNAFNFMDGVDGIAAITAWASAMAFAVAADRASHDGALYVLSGATALASLGFLPLNFPRARIFMGDAGSLPLGLLLASCAVRANSTGALPFPASILLLGPFLFDVTFTLVRRAIERKPIGEAHREHLYQRLSRVWDSHVKVTLLYGAFSAATGVLALGYAAMSDAGKLLSLSLPLVAMLGFAHLVLRAERVKGR